MRGLSGSLDSDPVEPTSPNKRVFGQAHDPDDRLNFL